MAKEDKKKKEDEEKEEGKAPEEGGDKAEEGGDAAEGEGGEKKKKPSSKKKKIIFILVPIVVIIAIAVPAILYLTGHLGKKASIEGELAGEGGEGGKGGKNQTVFYDMEEFLVNLNVGSKRPSFLKMTVSLEVANELQIPIIEKNMPRVRDNFQVYLRELRQDDLQGSAGLYRLREELLLRVNKAVYPAKVNDILFKEILVQ